MRAPLGLLLGLGIGLAFGCGGDRNPNHGDVAQDTLDYAMLRQELIERGERDQHYRTLDYGEMDDSVRARTMAEAMAVDSANAARIKEVVSSVGWPGRERFGEEASHAAWLLIQHADADPAFQAAMLPLAEDAARRGEASWSDVAYLTDRVRVKQGRPQVYGTQYAVDTAPDGSVRADSAGRLVYLPPIVEDPATLDERRRAVGLGPWIEYEQRMARLHERTPVDRPRSADGGSANRR